MVTVKRVVCSCYSANVKHVILKWHYTCFAASVANLHTVQILTTYFLGRFQGQKWSVQKKLSKNRNIKKILHIVNLALIIFNSDTKGKNHHLEIVWKYSVCRRPPRRFHQLPTVSVYLKWTFCFNGPSVFTFDLTACVWHVHKASCLNVPGQCCRMPIYGHAVCECCRCFCSLTRLVSFHVWSRI